MPSYIAFSIAGLIMIGICALFLFLVVAYVVICHYKKLERD